MNGLEKTAQELYESGKVSHEAAQSAIGDPFRVEVLKQLTDMASALREINTALVGNDKGTTGLVKRMYDVEQASRDNKAALEEERQRVNLKLAKAGGILTAVGFIFTALAAWWEGHK